MATKRKSKALAELPAPVPDETPVAAIPHKVAHPAPGNDYIWLAASAAITVIAALLRFISLGIKPLHHDEGVNGYFLKTLFTEGVYKYDPANYHGPTLYYITLAFTKVFGFETVPVRASVAVFGLLTVVLALFLRRYIGTAGSLLAALFLALSPGMVYISRYFIHEIFFVFLSLAVVVAVLFFIEKRAAGIFAIAWMVLLLLVCFLPSALNLASSLAGSSEGALWTFRIAFFIAEAVLAYFVVRMLLTWDDGRPIYLILAAASVALLFATKETAFITLGTMLIACFCVWIWRSLRFGALLERNWTRVIVGVHIAIGVAAIYFRQYIFDAAGWLSSTFLGPSRTPESFVFYSIIALMVGAAVTWALYLIDEKNTTVTTLGEPAEVTFGSFTAALGDGRNRMFIVAAVAVAFAYIFILFFSSFFTYAEGISKAFEAYAIWTKTGNKDHTQNGLIGYLRWGIKVEAPILILSLLGTLIAFVKARHRFALFAGLWSIGMFAAYSIIPYKTPWLALSFLLPMCIIAGYGLNELLRAGNRALPAAAVVVSIVAVALLSYQTYQHNFVRYDDEEMTYVYAHTRRGFMDMVREIEFYAAKSGRGTEATIEVVSPDYWPLTWYVKDYTNANFHSNLVDASTSEIIVAKKNDQDAGAIQRYANHYKFVGVYPLRPGVNLTLLVRRDLAEPDDQDLLKILEYKTVPGYTN